MSKTFTATVALANGRLARVSACYAPSVGASGPDGRARIRLRLLADAGADTLPVARLTAPDTISYETTRALLGRANPAVTVLADHFWAAESRGTRVLTALDARTRPVMPWAR